MNPSLKRSRWPYVVAAVVGVGVIGAAVVASRMSGIVEQKVIEALKSNYGSNVEFKSIKVSLFPKAKILGEQLVLRRPDSGDLPPFLSIDRFTAEASFLTLLRPTPHIGLVVLEGLRIHVPPRKEPGQQTADKSDKSEKKPVHDFSDR